MSAWFAAMWMVPVVIGTVWIAPALRAEMGIIDALRCPWLDQQNPAVKGRCPVTWETARPASEKLAYDALY